MARIDPDPDTDTDCDNQYDYKQPAYEKMLDFDLGQ